MKLRLLSSILIFISAYSPLSIIFLIQDIDLQKGQLKNPEIVWPFLAISVISCLLLYASVKLLKVSTPPVKIKKVSLSSSELINYSIPYMISFFVMDLGDKQMLYSFLFFMLIMYWLTLKTHNIFVNPILAVLGYNLYKVTYERNNSEYEDTFIVKGARLVAGDTCRVVELSEQLYLVTERNSVV
jgi:hypothetical protein